MTEPLEDALSQLRPLLLDPEGLVRAIAAGRRRGTQPSVTRAELRPVDLKTGRRLQVTTTGGRTPMIRNLDADQAAVAVDDLLHEPFGSWRIESKEQVVQLRVTKSGQAQVHRAPNDGDAPATDHDRAKRHLIDPGDRLFTALGAGAAKRRQVDAFLQLLAPVARRIRKLFEAGQHGDERPLRVVDLGCGNAYLTMAAHRYLSDHMYRPVQTAGVDVRPEMAGRNTELAARIGLTGLTFVASSIEDAEGPLTADGPIDLVLALHACDTATDDALALAVRWKATAVLAAPCCHHDIQRQLENAGPGPEPGLTRHPILKQRFADVLTDAARADLLRLLGYRTDVVEFIDSRHTPRNAMIRAVHTGTPPTARRIAEYTELVQTWHVEPALARRLRPELASVLGSAE